MAGPPYGLVPTGFNVKPQEAVLSDMQAKQLAQISPTLDLQPTALIGVMNGIVSAAVAENWEVTGALYNGMDPDNAADDQLTGLSLITGTEREDATKTQVPSGTVNVDGGFSADPFTMFASVENNPTSLFTNKTLVENPGGAPADVLVEFEAVNPGPVRCPAGTLTVRQQSLSGWNSVDNTEDGVIGHNIEGDPALRVKREEELAAAGNATAAALRADVLREMQPPRVSSATLNCLVLWNDTDAVDADGLPPHTFEVIAYQPGNTADDDQILAQFILDSKSAGIGTSGVSAKTATDSQGVTQAIRYTRPTPIGIYIALTLKTNPKLFPANGVQLAETAIGNYAQGAWFPGSTVYALATRAAPVPNPAILGSGVPGVLDVPTFTIDTVDPPAASSNIPISVREIAQVSEINTTVI